MSENKPCTMDNIQAHELGHQRMRSGVDPLCLEVHCHHKEKLSSAFPLCASRIWAPSQASDSLHTKSRSTYAADACSLAASSFPVSSMLAFSASLASSPVAFPFPLSSCPAPAMAPPAFAPFTAGDEDPASSLALRSARGLERSGSSASTRPLSDSVNCFSRGAGDWSDMIRKVCAGCLRTSPETPRRLMSGFSESWSAAFASC